MHAGSSGASPNQQGIVAPLNAALPPESQVLLQAPEARAEVSPPHSDSGAVGRQEKMTLSPGGATLREVSAARDHHRADRQIAERRPVKQFSVLHCQFSENIPSTYRCHPERGRGPHQARFWLDRVGRRMPESKDPEDV